MSSLREMSFLDLYLLSCGHTMVPTNYHYYAAISLLAAALNDRVWTTKFKDTKSKLYPSLYVLIVGPSGSGKDIAIDKASEFVIGCKKVNLYYGKFSGAGFADVLNEEAATEASREDAPSVWLVFPELKNSIGKGDLAEDFIARLTALSSRKKHQYREVTHGRKEKGDTLNYPSPLINTLFGSTQDWLIKSVSPEAIASGAMARMLVTSGSYTGTHDHSERVFEPTYPKNLKDILEEIKRRLDAILSIEGHFTFDDRARAIHKRWFETRPAPVDDPRMMATWVRNDDTARKLGIVLSPAVQYGAKDRVITVESITAAERLVTKSNSELKDLFRWATKAKGGGFFEIVMDEIRTAGRIPHSALLRKVGRHSIYAPELKKCVHTLLQREQITIERIKGGAHVYEWKNGKRDEK